MRIALMTETFFPAVDGTTTTVKAVLDRLVDLGHQVLVVAPGPGLSTYRGCRVARVRQWDKPGSQVREAIDAFRPDLVHATSPGTVGRKALKHAARLGIPTLVVEQSPAAASGVPVVAPHAGGAPDVVRNLETGLLYAPSDEHALARAVAAIVADSQRALLGARARELATRDWRSAADELVERHYLDLVGTRQAASNR